MSSSEPTLTSELASKLRGAMARIVGKAPRVTVLYSGGVDSSLVARAASELTAVGLVSVGTQGSIDLSAAESGSRLLNLPWTYRTVEQTDIRRLLLEDPKEWNRVRPVSRAVLVGTALAIEAASDSTLLCGQGADELFLGYAHFEDLSAAKAADRREQDIEALLGDTWPRSVELARRRGRLLRSPFVEPEFLHCARGISIDQLRAGGGRKPLLRSLAREMLVPEPLAARPKKAFQYGSGIDRLLRSFPAGG